MEDDSDEMPPGNSPSPPAIDDPVHRLPLTSIRELHFVSYTSHQRCSIIFVHRIGPVDLCIYYIHEPFLSFI